MIHVTALTCFEMFSEVVSVKGKDSAVFKKKTLFCFSFDLSFGTSS